MSKSQVDYFDDWKNSCLKEKNYFLNWGGQQLNEALRGTSEGMSILLGGQSNHGKSILMTNTVLDLLKLNEDLIVIDFTLDDPKKKRITQYIASMSKVDMNKVDFANNMTNETEIFRFNESCSTLREWLAKGKLQLFENSSDDIEMINQASIRFLESKTEEIRKENKKAKIVVAIDSLNDIEVKGEDALARSEGIAKSINRMITRNGVVLIASTHLRKNGGRRPTLEDVKGNNFLAYSAKVIIGVHNDVKLQKDKAKVFWKQKTIDGSMINMPVIESHFLKSKVSDWNGVLFYRQWPSWGRVEEMDEVSSKVLKSIVYESI